MNIQAHMTSIQPTDNTGEILVELGRRLQRYRLQQNRTRDDIAADAGVSAITIARAEGGDNPTLETVVRILRALKRLDALDAFLPAPLVSPMDLAKLGGRERKRAGTPRTRKPPEKKKKN